MVVVAAVGAAATEEGAVDVAGGGEAGAERVVEVGAAAAGAGAGATAAAEVGTTDGGAGATGAGETTGALRSSRMALALLSTRRSLSLAAERGRNDRMLCEGNGVRMGRFARVVWEREGSEGKNTLDTTPSLPRKE